MGRTGGTAPAGGIRQTGETTATVCKQGKIKYTSESATSFVGPVRTEANAHEGQSTGKKTSLWPWSPTTAHLLSTLGQFFKEDLLTTLHNSALAQPKPHFPAEMKVK